MNGNVEVHIFILEEVRENMIQFNEDSWFVIGLKEDIFRIRRVTAILIHSASDQVSGLVI